MPVLPSRKFQVLVKAIPVRIAFTNRIVAIFYPNIYAGTHPYIKFLLI